MQDSKAWCKIVGQFVSILVYQSLLNIGSGKMEMENGIDELRCGFGLLLEVYVRPGLV